MSLDSKAVLVQLSLGMPTFRRLDKTATNKVQEYFRMSNKTGSFTKRCIISQTLDNITDLETKIRTWFYDSTLPWGMKGVHLLSSRNLMSFRSEFNEWKKLWNYDVTQFHIEYPQLKIDATRYLGDSYNPKDYPPEDTIAERFKLDVAILPVPADDFRVELTDVERAELQEELTKRKAKAEQHAQEELQSRLYEPLKALATALADPIAVFRDSKVTNLENIVRSIDKLNFMDDPTIDSIKAEIQDKLMKHNINTLRNDPVLRQQKGDEAQEIVRKMSAFMGTPVDTTQVIVGNNYADDIVNFTTKENV